MMIVYNIWKLLSSPVRESCRRFDCICSFSLDDPQQVQNNEDDRYNEQRMDHVAATRNAGMKIRAEGSD